MRQFDLAILGGGPGGYTAAIRAAKLGKKTALIEQQDMGGTCLNRGCIPTKALLHCAELYQEMKHASQFGIAVDHISFDFSKAAERKDQVVGMLRGGVEALVKGAGVTVFHARGELKSENVICAGDEEIYAENVILATGAAPARPPLKGAGLMGVITSDEALALTDCPESVIVIGGGVIGLEFATIFASLGKKVIVIEMLEQILNGFDNEICNTIKRTLQKKNVEFHTDSKVLEIKEGLVCVFDKGGVICEATAQTVLMAVGRTPATKGIGLEQVGIETERGFIPVDEEMRTSVPNIFAIGDITGKVQLAHVASAQALTAVENACGGRKVLRYDVIPACVYTNPEIAYVGLSEKQASEQGYSVKTGSFPVAANGKSMVMGVSQGKVKLVSDAENGKIIGCQMMAPHATDMIAEIAAVMELGGTVDQLSDVVHPHPTISEMVMEASHDVHKLCTHKL